MNMRFLVTGGAGFIGSTMVRHLVEKTTDDVVVIDKLTYAGNLNSLSAVSENPRYRFVRADISDAPRMPEIIEDVAPDIVVNLAAETHVDRSIDGAIDFIQTNVVGTAVLLDAILAYWRKLPAARRGGFRFHQVSTDEVFGSLGPADPPFQEASPYRPNSPYAASKASADHMVRAWHNSHGLPTVITNCSNNYGPFQFPEKLIPLMILNCLEGKSLPVYGRGENVRDWLFVGDHVDALVMIAKRGKAGATYNIGGNCQRTNVEVVQAICSLVDDLLPGAAHGPCANLIAFVADRPGHDLRYAVDTSLVESEFGWVPQESFESGLEKTVRWYLLNQAWWRPLREATYRGERLGLASAPPQIREARV